MRNLLVELPRITWGVSYGDLQSRDKNLEDIEIGKVLFFPKLNFELQKSEKKFLTPECADPKRKNISLDLKKMTLKGSVCTGEEAQQLGGMIARFAQQSHDLIISLFPSYQNHLQWGRTTFRPVEVFGRQGGSYRKDDTRLHVDAFVTKPVQGRRLLRVFTNINPYQKPRLWRLGESFEQVAQRFLPQISHEAGIIPYLLKIFGFTHGLRTPYDHLMLQIHDTMKRDLNYQKTVPYQEISFPSGSTWVVMTDKVSHAALSGQFLLEQTFYLPVESMKLPDQSPLHILEQLIGKSLVS